MSGIFAESVGCRMPSLAAAGAILTIDLDAIRENYRRLHDRLVGARGAAVVKADGYGLGAVLVAKALMAEGCDNFFVAHVGEGTALRTGLGKEPAIYVLNGIPPGAETEILLAGLIPVLNSIPELQAWSTAASRAGRALPAALQVDSGMSRLGMAPDEVEAIAADPKNFEGIDLVLVMSHLACADEPSHPANRAQRLEFERLRRLLPDAPASLANSSGTFLDPSWRFDLARLGVALYGVNPTPAQENPMRPVVRLEAKVIQTRDVPAGAGVGYGYDFTAPSPMRLATISLGYADGWPRRAAAAAFVDGARLPFVGRVSMDMIVIDISALPPDRLRRGDLVELIGPSQSVDDIAAAAGTIGYEILTSLGHRFHRRYIGDVS